MLSHNLNIISHSFSPNVGICILLLCIALLFLLERDQSSNNPDLRVGAGHASFPFMSSSLDRHKRVKHLFSLHRLTIASKKSRRPQLYQKKYQSCLQKKTLHYLPFSAPTAAPLLLLEGLLQERLQTNQTTLLVIASHHPSEGWTTRR